MNSPQFVSLFSGAGGLDIGFESAGWSCAYASDVDQAAVSTLMRNRGRRVRDASILAEAFIETADVNFLKGREVLSKAGLRRGDATALVGGPPCQSWSSAGRQLGFADSRGRLLYEYVRLASELDVRWLVFENVRGLLTARGVDGEPGAALHEVRQALLDGGFQTEVNLLNAADYGVPQRRVRLFLIGFRRGDRPPFPTTTHTRSPGLFDTVLQPWVTLGECLRKVEPLLEDEVIRPSAALAAQLAKVAEGSGVRSPGKAETTRPGGHWGYKQGAFVADPKLPARTVTASAQQDWVRDLARGLRRLCPRECAAIQTFPPSWQFEGNRVAQYRQIGNAVPVGLAEAIARPLLQHVLDAQKFRSRHVRVDELLPLPKTLVSAIEYTRRDNMRNGDSRRAAPAKRRTPN